MNKDFTMVSYLILQRRIVKELATCERLFFRSSA